MCYIEEMEGQPLFKVKVVEKGHEDLVLTGSTPKGKPPDSLYPGLVGVSAGFQIRLLLSHLRNMTDMFN